MDLPEPHPLTGDDLKSALGRLGWSQTELARRLSGYAHEPVGARTARRWCSGETPVPGALALAVALLLREMEDDRGAG